MLRRALFGTPSRKRPSKAEREALYKAQSGRCYYCGIRLDIAHMTIEHKQPVARKGSESLSNKVVTCFPCNHKKGQMTNGEFRTLYKLEPARQAKGPPEKAIPQEYFNSIDKANRTKKAALARKKKQGSGNLWHEFFKARA